jgi:hypothetical protein
MDKDALLHLRTLARSERFAVLADRVMGEVRYVLPRTDGGGDVPSSASLFDVGLTSLGEEILRTRLETAFGCAIDGAEMFNHLTVARLTAYIENRLFPETQREGGEAAAAPQHTSDERTLAGSVIANLYRTS